MPMGVLLMVLASGLQRPMSSEIDGNEGYVGYDSYHHHGGGGGGVGGASKTRQCTAGYLQIHMFLVWHIRSRSKLHGMHHVAGTRNLSSKPHRDPPAWYPMHWLPAQGGLTARPQQPHV